MPLIYAESAAIHILNQIDKGGIHKIDIPKKIQNKFQKYYKN